MSHASVVITGQGYMSKAEYKCSTGYESSGSMMILCSESGEWTSPIATCKIIECPQRSLPLALLVSSLQRTYGTIIYASCAAGHQFTTTADGKSYIRITCLATGQWDRPLPICEPVHCPALRVVSYSIQSSSNTQFGSEISYRCQQGFDLIGLGHRRCLSSGNWSSPAPVCKPIRCGLLGLKYPQNSIPTAVNDSYLGKAIFSCKRGYRSTTNQLVQICQSNRQWTAPVSDCKGGNCKSNISHNTSKFSIASI